MKPDQFIKWSQRAYTEKQRLVAMIPLGILFVMIMPALLV